MTFLTSSKIFYIPCSMR